MKYLISSNDSNIGFGEMYIIELPDVIEKCIRSNGYEDGVTDIHGVWHTYYTCLNMDELNEMMTRNIPDTKERL